MDQEKLTKIDALIDQMFSKSESPVVPEPKKDGKNPQTPELAEKVRTADEGEKPEEGEDEKEGTRGRPKDPSNMDERDASGESHLNYPESVSSPAMTPPNETTVAKSDKIEVSKEDFELLQKAKSDREAEVLKKAKDEQRSLIKSVVLEATKEIRSENAELKKSLNDTQEMLKKALKQPKVQKSISSVNALEKSFGGNSPDSKDESKTFSKSEMLDAAEVLVKSGKLPVEAAIELEDTGSVFNPSYRAAIEQELARKR